MIMEESNAPQEWNAMFSSTEIILLHGNLS